MPDLLHASGRFDAPAKAFAHDLTRWMLLASIVTMTEVARPGRLRKLLRLARRRVIERTGWTRTGGRGEGPGECAIMSDRKVWQRRHRWVLPLTKGGGLARLRARLYVTCALLRHRAGDWLLLVLTTHMPAHVETALREWVKQGRPLTVQARAWLTALDSLAEHTADLTRKHPHARLWIPCDWNVDADDEWARGLILDTFASHGLHGLRIVHTKAPTLGGRHVDFAVTNLAVGQMRVLDAKASDHDAFLAEVG